MTTWLSTFEQAFEVRYYFCLAVSVVSVLIVSFGYHWTNEEKPLPQFLILILMPGILFCFASFLSVGLGVATLTTLVMFISLLIIGEFLGFVTLEWTPNHQWVNMSVFVIYWVIFVGVPLVGLALAFMLKGWLIVTLISGGIFSLFIVLTVVNDGSDDWLYIFLAYILLGAILAISGYSAYSHFDVRVFAIIAAFFGSIGFHFLVDGLKDHSTYTTPFHRRAHGYVSTHSNYDGASTIPLGLALSVAVGGTSYICFGSLPITLLWVVLAIACYYLGILAMDDWRAMDFPTNPQIFGAIALIFVVAVIFPFLQRPIEIFFNN